MKFDKIRFVKGIFLDRPNRFLVHARIGERIESCHLPDPGRLKELLIEGSQLLLTYNPSPSRKTAYTCQFIKHNGIWVSIRSTTANELFKEGIINSTFPDFRDWHIVKEEFKSGSHRFDFLLGKSNYEMIVEVKSVTLVRNKIAYFPDAVTERGRKHVEALKTLKEKGFPTALVFIIQRKDAEAFSPQWDIDPKFSQSLYEAYFSGLPVYAYSYEVNPEKIDFSGKLPLILDVL